jgi:hypothetical protein
VPACPVRYIRLLRLARERAVVFEIWSLLDTSVRIVSQLIVATQLLHNILIAWVSALDNFFSERN